MPPAIPPQVAFAEMLAAGVRPLVEYPGACVPWQSVCETCGETVSPMLHNIRRGSRACVYCAGLRLTDQAAAEQMQSHGCTPLEPYPGSNKAPWRCTCSSCGQPHSPSLNNVAKTAGRCRTCGSTERDKTTKRRNYSAVAIAGLARIGGEPLEDYPGALLPWRCRCTRCGVELAVLWGNARAVGRIPCECHREYGFRLTGKGYVYVVARGDGFAQFGVTKHPKRRFAEHRRNGFDRVVELAGPMPASDAWAVERRLKELLASSPKPAGVFDGHTESFTLADLQTSLLEIASSIVSA